MAVTQQDVVKDVIVFYKGFCLFHLHFKNFFWILVEQYSKRSDENKCCNFSY